MSDSPRVPKVFISHASEDKDRFVRDFAARLRSSGVDAWLDEWEIHPGDDLPRRIFEEGIHNADTVIVVLSKSFVAKPWPQHELSASLVRRIYGDIRIIPVVIEKCEIPQSLQATYYVRIEDLQNYDASLEKVLRTLFDSNEKPPLGAPPKYAQLQVDSIPGLSQTDTNVLKLLFRNLQKSDDFYLRGHQINSIAEELQLSQDDLIDILHILEDRNVISPTWFPDGDLLAVKLSLHGTGLCMRSFVDGANDIINGSLLAIVNSDKKSGRQIVEHLNRDRMLIEYALDLLEGRRLIRGRRYSMEDGFIVHEVTPLGRRFVDSLK